MRININDFGHELYDFVKKSHREESVESMRNQLKDLFAKHGIDDSNFALISVAVSGNGVETEAKNTSTYIDKISKKLFEKEERIKYREMYGKDPESQEDVKKIKKPKPSIVLDMHKLSKLTSKTEIKTYINFQLANQNKDGLNFSELATKTVTSHTQNEFNMPVNLGELEGQPLVDGLVENIYSKRPVEMQNQGSRMSDSERQSLDKNTSTMDIEETAVVEAQKEMNKEMGRDSENKTPEQKPKNLSEDEIAKKSVQKTINQDEDEFDITKIGEGSADINYFVGYDKEAVGKLFAGKPQKFIDLFKDFVARFNKLMNRLLNQDLGEQTVDQIQNDIDPEFLKFAAECSNYGAEGAQIQNLCRGMIAIFNRTCDMEREGKDINGLKLKAQLESTQALDHTDRDGLRRESTEKDGSGKPSIIKAIDNSVGSNGLIEDALTEEDQREIDLFGITGILTHSAMELFRREPEYELLQNLNMLGLSRDDSHPM